MNLSKPFPFPSRKLTWTALVLLLLILLAAEVLASQVQTDFGQVQVSNVHYQNFNGIPVRAKLLKSVSLSSSHPGPGVVYIHGYQNNRETSDPYAIEMARRGFVVLEIDAIGRGNSGNPGDPEDPNFDPTFGGRTSFEYLKSLPYVDPDSVGLMGHSLGAEMAYTIALEDPSVKALVISGFAYREDATRDRPQNMLMIFGKYDEYRERMTGTNDVEEEWLSSPATQAAIGGQDLAFGVTYGSFVNGTARQVVLLPGIHLMESHSRAGVEAALTWMRAALNPDPGLWVPATDQIWEIKEYATLVAMMAGLFSVIPLGTLLLGTKFFGTLRGVISDTYACTRKELWGHATINGLLMWLYLPIIFVLFGLHVYVVPIDKVFPMMMVNGTVWWFLWINVIGFFILRRWYRRKHAKTGLSWSDLGISFREDKFALDWGALGKTALLGLVLFAGTYALESILEAIFIVDYRFIFPFASDLTPYRFGMCLLYFPFLLVGFLQVGFFLHGQVRGPKASTWSRTYLSWSLRNILVMVVPLILFLLVQYLPLFTAGVVPFVGPGGMLVSFTMNLFHIIGVLVLILPVQTWFFQLTGRPYLGAILNAAIVAWMFASSQVIAPIPV
jgi:pimeloyl-ACP methyl ester carboxylesterase